MSSLKYQQKEILERIFQMSGGYVLQFTNSKFSEFFRDFNVDIYNEKYRYNSSSSSKANLLRAFWEKESDELVGRVLHGLLDLVKIDNTQHDINILEEARLIANSLATHDIHNPYNIKDFETVHFLSLSFETDFIENDLVTHEMATVLTQRFKEISACLKAKAYLATVILAGSLLEGLLIELAKKNVVAFNKSACSPKNSEGKVRKFNEWTLAELIDVAHDTCFINVDVKKFSTSLRDFRNYIHPQEQLKSNFHPNEHTAAMALQVLKAALADISNKRPTTKLWNTDI